jgi:hypothetical protein
MSMDPARSVRTNESLLRILVTTCHVPLALSITEYLVAA